MHAAGHDAMHMRVVIEGLAPGMQHRGDADVGSQVFWIGRNRGQRLGRRRKQQAVDLGLVLIGDGADLGRQGEDNVEVGNRQQLGLARFQPRLRRPPLALGTVPIAAGVISDARVRTVLAALDMPAERRGATDLDRRHDAPLGKAEMRLVGGPPGSAEAVEDIRHLQLWPRHAEPITPAALSP